MSLRLKSLQWQQQMKEVKSGWLTKQGGKYKTWKKRWFVIRGLQILYYKDPGDAKPLGVITLAYPLDTDGSLARQVRAIDETDVPGGRRKFCFEIGGNQAGQRTYYCCGADDDDMNEWIDAISRIVHGPRGGGMFGEYLTVHIRKSSPPGGPTELVPKVVRTCVEYLKDRALQEVGLFRLPGRSTKIKELRALFQSGHRPNLAEEDDIHAVASLMKLYLRELPEPLLTHKHFDEFLEAAKTFLSDKPKGTALIKAALNKIPPSHAMLAAYVSEFLSEVQEHSEVNKMDVKNLATVFSPCYIVPKSKDPLVLMESASLTNVLTCTLITHHTVMFENVKDRTPKERDGSTNPAIYAEEELLDDWDSEDETPHSPLLDLNRRRSRSLTGVSRKSVTSLTDGSSPPKPVPYEEHCRQSLRQQPEVPMRRSKGSPGRPGSSTPSSTQSLRVSTSSNASSRYSVEVEGTSQGIMVQNASLKKQCHDMQAVIDAQKKQLAEATAKIGQLQQALSEERTQRQNAESNLKAYATSLGIVMNEKRESEDKMKLDDSTSSLSEADSSLNEAFNLIEIAAAAAQSIT